MNDIIGYFQTLGVMNYKKIFLWCFGFCSTRDKHLSFSVFSHCFVYLDVWLGVLSCWIFHFAPPKWGPKSIRLSNSDFWQKSEFFLSSGLWKSHFPLHENVLNWEKVRFFVSERKRTFSYLSWFSSAQPGEFTFI